MIYIVRHGKTDWNKDNKITGHTDISLNENGVSDAKRVRDELKNIKFDYVFSSPLKRAYETAKIITDDNIILDKRIMERYNGLLEGTNKDEFNLLSDKEKESYEVESLDSIHLRAKEFLDEILYKYPGKNILIVTHAGIGINLRCILDGDPRDKDISKYRLKNCEIYKYDNERV